MTTYNTGNSIGSADPRDLYDNAQVVDEYANSDDSTTSDRLGNTRKTLAGMNSEFDADQSSRNSQFDTAQDQRADEFDTAQDGRQAQFVQLMISGGYTGTGVDGAIEDYAAGIEFTSYKQIVRADGEFWRPAADTELPYTTTGDGVPEGGALVNVGDGLLRQDLVQPVATFNNVQDMKDAVFLDVGRKARTLGYYAPGDGGGNDYEIVAAGTGTDDGGSFIDLSGSGLQAQTAFAGVIPLAAFGAAGDGFVDDTARIQAAIDYASVNGGGEVKGKAFAKYKIDVNTIEVKPYVVLLGLPDMLNAKNSSGGAPSFEVYTGKGGTSTPAFLVKANASIKGFTFNYPEQVDADLRDPATGTILTDPIEYGYTIQTTGGTYASDRIALKDLMLYNSYLGIDYDRGGQSVIERIYGQPIKVGLRCEQWLDIINVENVHFWPFNVPTKSTALGQWILSNGTSFSIGNVDGPTFKSCFSFGYQKGIHLTDFGEGSPWMHWVGGGIDWSKNPLYIEKSELNTTFTDCFFIGDDDTSSNAITTSPSIGEKCFVSFSNVGVWNVSNGAVVSSSDGTFIFNNFISKSPKDGDTYSGNDIGQFLIINEGNGAKVDVNGGASGEGSPLHSISGTRNTWFNGIRIPEPNSEATSMFKDITDPTGGIRWKYINGGDEALENTPSGFIYTASNAVEGSLARYLLPPKAVHESGIYILEFNINTIESGNGEFQFRIMSHPPGKNVRHTLFFPSPTRLNFSGEKISIPFIIPQAPDDTYFDIIMNSGSCVLDISNFKIYKTKNYEEYNNYLRIIPGTRRWQSEHDGVSTHVPLKFRGENKIIYGFSAPTFGDFSEGDECVNISSTGGGTRYWLCVGSGAPGIWKSYPEKDIVDYESTGSSTLIRYSNGIQDISESLDGASGGGTWEFPAWFNSNNSYRATGSATQTDIMRVATFGDPDTLMRSCTYRLHAYTDELGVHDSSVDLWANAKGLWKNSDVDHVSASFPTIDRTDLMTTWQGVAFDGEYYYTTATTIYDPGRDISGQWGIKKYNRKFENVTSEFNNTTEEGSVNSMDWADGEHIQINGLYYEKETHVLYVCANAYTAPNPDRGWVILVDPDTLTQIDYHYLGDFQSEAVWPWNGSWWHVHSNDHVIEQYDSSWNHVATHSLPEPYTGDTFHWQALWVKDDVFYINNHGTGNLGSATLRALVWDGSSFQSAAYDLRRPNEYCKQGVYFDGSRLYWAERRDGGPEEDRGSYMVITNA